VSNRTGILWHF